DVQTLSVAWNGTEYVVVFANWGDVMATTVRANGTVKTPSTDLTTRYGNSLAQIAFDCEGPSCILGLRRLAVFIGNPEGVYDPTISAVVVSNPSKRPEVVLTRTWASDVVVAERRGSGAIFFSAGGA